MGVKSLAVLPLLLLGCAPAAPQTTEAGAASGEARSVPASVTHDPPPHTSPAAPLPRGLVSRASRVRTATPTTPRPRGGRLHSHAPGSLNWTALARCESGGNPRATNPSGKYRGLYQADATFWKRYGGLVFAARPDLATPAQQTAVARRGYAVQGRGAWPECGRFL